LDLGHGLAVFQTFGQHVQRERLRLANRFLTRRAIGEHARQLGHLGDPPAVGFALRLDFVHGNILPRGRNAQQRYQRSWRPLLGAIRYNIIPGGVFSERDTRRQLHDDAGRVATYFARWVSQRGEFGPWSIPASMTIAA